MMKAHLNMYAHYRENHLEFMGNSPTVFLQKSRLEYYDIFGRLSALIYDTTHAMRMLNYAFQNKCI